MPTIRNFPREDQTNGWTRTIPARTPRPQLKGDVAADLLIIGAGYAGMGAAWHYARTRPNDRIAMLDAQVVGQGASGRNSGFVLGLKHATDGSEITDPEPLKRLLRISQAATRFLDEIVTTHQIRCDWRKDGMYMAARGPEGLRRIGILKREFERIGEPCRVLDRKEAERETGTAHYRAMLFSPNCILMQPGKLIHGLADRLPQNVALHEQSRVTRIDYGPKITAHTDGGSVTAPKLILATNGFTPEFGFFERRIFPVRLFASLTRPLNEVERDAYTVKGWGILPVVHTSSPTMRYTEDHRILMRAGIGLGTGHDPKLAGQTAARRYHERLFRDRFPMLPNVDFEYTWAGFVCSSRNRAHGLAQVADNVFTAVCENGVGATKSVVSGIAAADMAMGANTSLGADLQAFGTPEPVPPSPFFEIGAAVKFRYEDWRDRAES
ncbi:MAG: FAD-binding oxidoreductase [Hyphomicrobiaceae bacterium]